MLFIVETAVTVAILGTALRQLPRRRLASASMIAFGVFVVVSLPQFLPNSPEHLWVILEAAYVAGVVLALSSAVARVRASWLAVVAASYVGVAALHGVWALTSLTFTGDPLLIPWVSRIMLFLQRAMPPALAFALSQRSPASDVGYSGSDPNADAPHTVRRCASWLGP